jgi:tetratricopeptide (TPR) repeat protein
MLDESAGRPPEAALGLLKLILERDEQYAPAYVELARFALKSSYLHTLGGIDRFSDDGQSAALALLDRASELEPEFADTWVLFGYLLPSFERNMLGLIALDRAERLHADSPWLPFNRARIQAAIGDLRGARRSFLAARASIDEGSGTDIAILGALTTLAETADEAERYYKELLRLAPDRPVLYGNYADFLIHEGRFDESIEVAHMGLRLNVYPDLAATLALALFAKAADLELKDDPLNSSVVFGQAQQVGYPVERVLHDASARPATHHVVFALAKHGVDMDSPNPFGRTVLFEFLTNGTEAQVRELLALGADPNAWDETVGTPLHTAIGIQSPELVEMLLEAGADPMAIDAHGVTAIELALLRNRPDIAKLLEDASGGSVPADWMLIAESVRNGNAAAIEEAIHFIQTKDPENIVILTALQKSVAETPSIVIPLTTGFGGVLMKICGHPVADDPSVSVQRRREAVESLVRTSGPVPPLELAECQRALVRAQTEDPRPSVPRYAPAEERPALLARATELFRQAEPHDWRLSEAESIVRTLIRSDPSDVAAHVLGSRIALAEAELMAARRGNYDPTSAVEHLEGALRHSSNSTEALELYRDILAREGHVALSDVVAGKAELDPVTRGP